MQTVDLESQIRAQNEVYTNETNLTLVGGGAGMPDYRRYADMFPYLILFYVRMYTVLLQMSTLGNGAVSGIYKLCICCTVCMSLIVFM